MARRLLFELLGGRPPVVRFSPSDDRCPAPHHHQWPPPITLAAAEELRSPLIRITGEVSISDLKGTQRRYPPRDRHGPRLPGSVRVAHAPVPTVFQHATSLPGTFMLVSAMHSAVRRFKSTIGQSDGLISLRDEIRTHRSKNKLAPTAGRPATEVVNLDRAVIVLTVAAWQAFIEDFAKACSQDNRFSTAARQAVGQRADLLSTPNVDKIRDLFAPMQLTPQATWGSATSPSANEAVMLNQWLNVRHWIAHGNAAPRRAVHHVLKVFQGLPSSATRKAAISVGDGERCVSFFKHLVATTVTDMATVLGRRLASLANAMQDDSGNPWI